MTVLRVALFGIVLIALAAAARAEESAVTGMGPVSGVLIDSAARTIRPILGMPGAAYAGPATVTSFEFAAAAPGSQNALIAKDGMLFVLRRLAGGRPVWRELDSGVSDIEFAAWSDNAEAIVLQPRGEARLDFWTTLSYEPKKAGSVDISSLSERMESVAVDPDGRFAFAATQGEDSGTLYLLKPGDLPRMLMPLRKAGSMMLAGNTLWVADRGSNEVFRLRNWDQMPQIQPAAAAAHGVNDPVGVALSRDGKFLWVASAGTRNVLAVDLDSSQVKHVLELDFTPTRMHRLGADGLFLLENGVPGEAPAQVLDTSAGKVYFVPVGALAE
jgi:DNA-binding beta-propeller fold protein YncE